MKIISRNRGIFYILVILMLLVAACSKPIKQESAGNEPAEEIQDTETNTSATDLSAEETAQEKLYEDIRTKANERREAILSSSTQITISGTSYYVSAAGDDSNDGLSEDTPWRTASKVNETDLQSGDGVFFTETMYGAWI